jgi:uncharacterized protein
MGLNMRIVCCHLQGPSHIAEHVLDLPEGTTVLTALASISTHLNASPALLLDQGLVGIWGRQTQADRVLTPDDRLEIYRPLLVDPKLARRQRFGQQGARSAGLFARRRPGAKPGY